MSTSQLDSKNQEHVDKSDSAAAFVFDVDDVSYQYDRPRITGAEIMRMANIDPQDGLIQILADNTRQTVAPDDTLHLVPGAQFKRRPRFKRG